jgi:hypothetical protein
MTLQGLILYLSREYPTATSAEIALTVGAQTGLVKKYTGYNSASDSIEYAIRHEPGIDVKLVRIMRRRIEHLE